MFDLFKKPVPTIPKLGSPYRSHPHRIIIDITSACNLNCIDCNRSCGQGQAPSNEHIHPDQIRKFVKQSREQDRLWYGRAEPIAPVHDQIKIEGGDPTTEGLRIEGGEPTLHPQLFEILDILLEYKHHHAPLTNIVLCTNGYGDKTLQILEKIPRDIVIINTSKTSRSISSHCAFNMAPKDDPSYKDHDFSNGCWLPLYYGIGLTRNGYYPHPICGGIDRVFGFKIALKDLPSKDHLWTKHYKKLCPYCGHYNKYPLPGCSQNANINNEQGMMSISWRKAYSKYNKNRK